jgi:ABC-2 type transport system ATP-binding protein
MVVLSARDLGLRTRRGWVFRGVDLDVEAGDVVALTGQAGSGRTSLLLALAGNFATSTGTVVRAGRAGLGQVPGVHDPEPALTVAELVRERLLLLGRAAGRPTAARIAEILDGYPAEPGTLGRDLDPYLRHLLMLRLAQLNRPTLIAVDDVDVALSMPERTALWTELRDVADRGIAVLATCREPGARAVEYRLDATAPADRSEPLERVS